MEKALSQRVQLKGFSPVCERLCIVRLLDLEKVLSGLVQANDFSPVCMR